MQIIMSLIFFKAQYTNTRLVGRPFEIELYQIYLRIMNKHLSSHVPHFLFFAEQISNRFRFRSSDVNKSALKRVNIHDLDVQA